MSSQPNNDNNNCKVVLTLAHLLMQHSLSYDTEKNALLQTSVRCASQLATSSSGGEIHIVLTGSPRPTFAETNALLLQQSNNAPNDIAMREGGDDDRPTQLKGSYSIADNIHHSNSNVFNEEEDEEMQNVNQQSDLQAYIQEFTNDRKASAAETNSQTSSSGGGGHNTSFIRRNTTGVTTSTNNNKTDVRTTTRRRSTIDAGENSVTNNTGPMVGQAVVNAISQSSGVGLQSSRSKLLQGTIDRPLWSQNRWTDGECLFSELVEMVGMKSFEMMDKTKQQQGGPDGAAGIGAATAPKNMSANLITVPATTLREPNAGVSQTTMDEIARGVLRTVKRKKSPPASKVYIVLPGVNHGVSEEKREVVVTFLKQAWEKLEQYNHMIGQPNLMSDADLEFVDFIV